MRKVRFNLKKTAARLAQADDAYGKLEYPPNSSPEEQQRIYEGWLRRVRKPKWNRRYTRLYHRKYWLEHREELALRRRELRAQAKR